MKMFYFGLGFLLAAMLFRAPAVEAQVEPGRTIYARYNGAAKALQATTAGYLYVVVN